jgi:predicted dehydrogenase
MTSKTKAKGSEKNENDKKVDYALEGSIAAKVLQLPPIPYLPSRPNYRPGIGLIACGGITSYHLQAYAKAGYRVVALTDPQRELAEKRNKEFKLAATICKDAAELLARKDLEVVDIATHPAERAPLIEAAIKAGKHILSQKPFVVDLDVGERLCQLADEAGVLLAVNQNGRWAPHVSWMRKCIAAGLIGETCTADALVAWDHRWVKGTPFAEIPHLLLYDFAIHWFDMLRCYFPGQEALQVTAILAAAPEQGVRPPLLANVIVQFPKGQGSIQLRGSTGFGAWDQTYITGTKGTIRSEGVGINEQTVTVWTAEGSGSPILEGKWFPDGFDGTMSELLSAVEEKRQPSNSGRNNLGTVAVALAAMESAERGVPVRVGEIRKVRPEWLRYVD